MKKIFATLAALALSTAAILPAQANTYGNSYTTPDGDGGCNSATYWEDWSGNTTYTWEVPALANGQSVTVDPSKYWWNAFGSYYEAPSPYHPGGSITFTCNNGTIAGANSYGYWY